MSLQNEPQKEDGNKCCDTEGISKGISLNSRAYNHKLVWKGTDDDTELEKFKRCVEKKYKRFFKSDRDFQRWSVDNFEDYWGTAWDYFGIISSRPFEKVFVKTGTGFLENDWFTDAKFNYAENLLRYRDDRVAIMYEDEDGNTDTVTYAEMYEQVRIYAAAFRKHGLKTGDRVACYMSNRKEAVFTILATFSIGAIMGGSIPFLGPQAAANLISRIEPKLLIASDRFQYDGLEHDVLAALPTISERATSIKKIIIVPSRNSTLSKDISHIKNSCFISEFLESALQEDGSVPELVFEQLPASHPVFLTFTSGTTGLAKATVHSARVIVHGIAQVLFTCETKKGDVLFSHYPVGWTPILVFVHCFALGATFFLYDGNVTFEKRSRNVWDVLSESKSKYVFFAPTDIDTMEKRNIIPKTSLSFEFLRGITLASCPVKNQNIEFLYRYLPKTTFVSSAYGSNEFFGSVTGVYLKSPSYAGENQLPYLGQDIRCYNDIGLPVIGEMGTLVMTTPAPNLPTCLWKDEDNRIMIYLSRFPGVWCQNDNCWINPVTHGILVRGRSDVTFVQNGERFEPADIYSSIHDMEEIVDYICVAQNREDGEERVVLFVKMKEGFEFTPSLRTKIEQKIAYETFVEWVPKVILPIKDVPYNVNNKRMESIVREILRTNQVPEVGNVKNPECLKCYCNIPEIINYCE